jgi:hypothetical protein
MFLTYKYTNDAAVIGYFETIILFYYNVYVNSSALSIKYLLTSERLRKLYVNTVYVNTTGRGDV